MTKPIKRTDDLVSYGTSAGIIGMAALVGLPVGAACVYLAYKIYQSRRK
tara:strand:+ start:1168 stop:1314 length:147 start_codon:yes stop_codon:yes gene_type:complete